MKQNYLKIFLAFLIILLIITIIKFFVFNRTTTKDNNIQSNSLIKKVSNEALVNDSLNRVLIKNDSIIIEMLKKHDKKLQ